MMTARIDPGKLSDVLSLAEKISRLDKETMIYIQGRVDQAELEARRREPAQPA